MTVVQLFFYLIIKEAVSLSDQRFSFGHSHPHRGAARARCSPHCAGIVVPFLTGRVRLDVSDAGDCVRLIGTLGEMPAGLNKRELHYHRNNTDESPPHRRTSFRYVMVTPTLFCLIRQTGGRTAVGIFADFPGNSPFNDIGWTPARHVMPSYTEERTDGACSPLRLGTPSPPPPPPQPPPPPLDVNRTPSSCHKEISCPHRAQLMPCRSGTFRRLAPRTPSGGTRCREDVPPR